MKREIYIIPGLGESCKEAQYNKLAKVLKTKGFRVHQVSINWYEPISEQVFNVERDSALIGFSLGAIIAYLIAKKYSCRKVIFASMSPIHNKKLFGYKPLTKYLTKYMSKQKAEAIAKDLSKIKISFADFKIPYITLSGEKETLVKGELLIPGAKHKIDKAYIKAIEKLI